MFPFYHFKRKRTHGFLKMRRWVRWHSQLYCVWTERVSWATVGNACATLSGTRLLLPRSRFQLHSEYRLWFCLPQPVIHSTTHPFLPHTPLGVKFLFRGNLLTHMTLPTSTWPRRILAYSWCPRKILITSHLIFKNIPV